MYKGCYLVAIITASGEGKRLDLSYPKQYIKTNDGCMLDTTIKQFERLLAIDHIIAVVDDSAEKYWGNIDYYKKSSRFTIVRGGATRQESVYNGLRECDQFLSCKTSKNIVLVHDGARPYVTSDLIFGVLDKLYDEASKSDDAICCVPALEPKDTIYDMDLGLLKRNRLKAIQTPEAVFFDDLMHAYDRAIDEDFMATDESQIVINAGGRVVFAEGIASNIKITSKEDLKMNTKVGMGYDVHRLVADRPLILGGVTIDHDKGLLGHSDADVLIHALMDAFCGALGIGDIGKHFPDNNDDYKGIDSMLLLDKIVSIMNDMGYGVQNCDMTIVCQKPKLAPYIEKMKNNIANRLCINPADVNVKATTTEGLGFEGTEEGISASAVVMIYSMGI